MLDVYVYAYAQIMLSISIKEEVLTDSYNQRRAKSLRVSDLKFLGYCLIVISSCKKKGFCNISILRV